MSRHTRWLLSEIERWAGEGIVSPEQATRLRARYAEAAPAVSWGMVVFFGIGTVIVGLGVILLFAYNWDEIPKAGKLALVFGSIAAAHGGGLVLRQRTDWRAMLGEALGLFGTMMFGAGIWLIAQIYNIDEHFPNGFLLWGLGALAMAWALPSIGQAIIATLVFSIWGTIEMMEFKHGMDFAPILLVVGIGPLAWRMRSAVLAAVLLAGLYAVVLTNAAHWNGFPGALTTALSISALLMGGARLLNAEQAPPRLASVMRFFGLLGFLIGAYILSFHGAADELLRSVTDRVGISVTGLVQRWAWFALAIGAWGWLAWRVRGAAWREKVPLDEWIFPAALAFAHAGIYQRFYLADAEWIVAGVFNVLVLIVGANWVARGCREGSLRVTALGTVLIALLVLFRYFDLFESLAVRGLVFVVCGAALFAEGFHYRRLRQATAGEEGRAAS